MNLSPVQSLIDSLTLVIRPYFDNIPEHQQPIIVGIETGGCWIAEIIHQKLNPATALGRLNISFYRDDFTKLGLHPTVIPSELPADIDGKTIILIDDVLYSGRTIRAAMNELFDYGRPNNIILAILIDRGERELPIQPDIVGQSISLEAGTHIKLDGPEPLSLSIRKIAEDG